MPPSRAPSACALRKATGFDPGLWKHLIETGAIGIRVPEAQGGSGAGLHDAAILAEQAGRALASVPLVEAICAAGLLARIEGDAARALLAEILDGGCIPALALREVDRSAQQLVPGGAAADAVLALDGDALVLAAPAARGRRAPRRRTSDRARSRAGDSTPRRRAASAPCSRAAPRRATPIRPRARNGACSRPPR